MFFINLTKLMPPHKYKQLKNICMLLKNLLQLPKLNHKNYNINAITKQIILIYVNDQISKFVINFMSNYEQLKPLVFRDY